MIAELKSQAMENSVWALVIPIGKSHLQIQKTIIVTLNTALQLTMLKHQSMNQITSSQEKQ